MKPYPIYLAWILLAAAAFSACSGVGRDEISQSMDSELSVAQPIQAPQTSGGAEPIRDETSSQNTERETIEWQRDFPNRLPQEQTLERLQENHVPPGYLYLEGYDYISYPSEGLVWAKKDGKVGFLDADDLSEAIPCIYDSANDFSEGYAPACLDGNYGYIDKANHIVIAFEYVYADPVKSGIAIVTTFSRPVYETPNSGLNPSYSLFSYAVINMESQAVLHESPQIIKFDQSNLFSPIQQLNLTGKYPIVAQSPTASVDINGCYAVHDGSVVYQNEPVCQVVEWSEKIAFTLLDPPQP